MSKAPVIRRAGAPQRLFAFLRAINVGGHVVAMAELRRIFTLERLGDVETFIASGNVIFTAAAAPAALEERLAARLERTLGYPVAVFVRTSTEMAAIAAYAPFPASRVRTAKAFCVGFLASPLGRTAAAALMSLRTPDDDFHLHGRELYWLTQIRQGESAFSNNLFEKTVKVQTTFRNMTTVQRLAIRYDLKA